MRTKPLALFCLVLLVAGVSRAQSTPQTSASLVVIRAGTLIDGVSETPRKNQLIFIRGNRIEKVSDASTAQPPAGASVVDLSSAVVLPGLIDSHTHIFLWGEDPAKGGYDANILNAGIALRAARATFAVRRALEQGFTTLRDVETEGAGYGDVEIKQAIEEGTIPGPRLFVATRAISSTGGYNLEGYAPELDMPKGAQLVDGPVEARKAAREQLDHGADWIKVYMTHRSWVDKQGNLVSQPTLTLEELKAIVDEAHGWGKKVACHAYNGVGLQRALDGGCDSIEHGLELTDANILVLPDDLAVLRQLGAGRHAGREARPRPRARARNVSPEGRAGSPQNCFRHGHGRHSVDGTHRPRISAHGDARHVPHGGDPGSDLARRRDAGNERRTRRRRAWRVRRYRRRFGRPVERHRRTRAPALRHEKRRHLQKRAREIEQGEVSLAALSGGLTD